MKPCTFIILAPANIYPNQSRDHTDLIRSNCAVGEKLAIIEMFPVNMDNSRAKGEENEECRKVARQVPSFYI